MVGASGWEVAFWPDAAYLHLMATQSTDRLAPRIALVIEGGRSSADHRALSLLADSLLAAGYQVLRLHHGLGRLARFRLRQQLRRFAADLFVVSGAASLDEAQGVATALGKPVVVCYWPLGVVHNPHVGPGADRKSAQGGWPSHVIVGTDAQRASVARWSRRGVSWSAERTHQFALPDGDSPPSAVLLQHIAELLGELLGEQTHRTIGSSLLRASAARVLPLLTRPRAVSLAYHQVVADLRGPDLQLVVGATTFERQLRALLSRGYRPLTQVEQARELLQRAVSASPSFAVSFDDGYLDTLEVAAPILRRLGVPFTVYVITDVMRGTLLLPWYELVQQAVSSHALAGRALGILAETPLVRDALAAEKSAPPLRLLPTVMRTMKQLPRDERVTACDKLWSGLGEEVLARPGRPRYLDRDGVRRLADLGAEVSSHTSRHELLPSLGDDDLQRELRDSRQVLIDLVGACPGLAYPNGDSDARVESAAADAGYEYAVTITPGSVSPFRLGRQMVSELYALGVGGQFSEPLFVAKLLRAGKA